MKHAIVLAAGKGTRMKSDRCKVMHEVCGKPMVGHIIDHLEELKVDSINVVVGYQQQQIRDYLTDRVAYFEQIEQKGTGHALMQVTGLEQLSGKTIILCGDVPLISKETMEAVFEKSENLDCLVVTAKLPDGAAYGRIVRNINGKISAIVEYKDASDEQRAIKEINTGIYCFDNQLLFKYLPTLTNDNVQHEYYLTDLIKIFSEQGHTVGDYVLADFDEAMGINDRVALAVANQWMQKKINQRLMENGVTIIDPKNTYIGAEVEIGEDTVIYPNVNLVGKTKIGHHGLITSGSWLENAVIGNHVTIESCKVIDSEIKDYTQAGPMSHFRGHSVVGENCRIGNFVEFKNCQFGNGSKCAHLTYLGDAVVGEKVNIGCGVVTVNYDGKNKFKTIIGDNSFIGSNCNLIAPIEIGSHAVVAAGSTITKNVGDDDMVIERAGVVSKPGYGKKYLSKEKGEGK